MDKNKQNFAKDINVPSKEQTNDSLKNSDKNFNENCTHNKEQIIIDGIQYNKFGGFYVDYDLNGKFLSISSSAKEYKILKSLIEQLARKTQECEELKKQLKTSEKWRINAESLNEKLSIEKYRYLKVLEEIDKVINNIFDKCLGHKTDGCTPVHNVCEELIKILDIISKAKGHKCPSQKGR